MGLLKQMYDRLVNRDKRSLKQITDEHNASKRIVDEASYNYYNNLSKQDDNLKDMIKWFKANKTAEYKIIEEIATTK